MTDKLLSDIRYAVMFILDSDDYSEDPFVVELANNFLKLDDFIRSGGQLPTTWKTPDRTTAAWKPWPSNEPARYNGKSEPCDMWNGPCSCGAWHANGK